MTYPIDQKNESKVTLVSQSDYRIDTVRDALDLIANVRFQGSGKMLLRKEQLSEDFFELRTKLAGEIVQKLTNYQMKAAIVGDFHGYESKSLRDFIYECNKGSQILFKSTEAEALEALHGLPS
ncbi:DUF4180 domain-containing protein [Gorillibacterium timonense]|uniref:DUF4180 domain-containing protein n=1 Tax=Gorillibacterium timonense TaxID=1689269 RepID=UPI00071D2B9C|nr:DUF4180 domain-containing protein [Gorillibacterium timonense]